MLDKRFKKLTALFIATTVTLFVVVILFLLTSRAHTNDSSNSSPPNSPPVSGLPTKTDAWCSDCNVLFIVADTLRADYLSVYGYPEITSPTIDTLASQSYLFRHNYANIPFTPPSHWSIFTGFYPNHHLQMVPGTLNSNQDTPVPPVLSTIMSEYGYRTAGFVSSQVVSFLDEYFQDFTAYEEQSDPTRLTGFRKTTDAALSWLDTNGQDKFFLFVHYWDVHTPYEPIPQFDQYQPRDSRPLSISAAKYAGEVSYLDSKVSELLAKLNTLGLTNNTIVVFTSDHGENFGEYNCDDFTWAKGPCEDHSVSLLDPEIHTPLLIYIPAQAPREITSVTQSIDLFPTLLELVGIPLEKAVDGTSLLPLMQGKEDPQRFAYSVMPKESVEYNIFSSSIVYGKWKLIRNAWVNNQQGKDQLILRLHDTEVNENANYLTQEPALTKNILDELNHQEEGGVIGPLREQDLNEDTLNLLKSLGYL